MCKRYASAETFHATCVPMLPMACCSILSMEICMHSSWAQGRETAQVKHPDKTDLSPPNLLVVDAGKGHGYGEEHHLIPYVEVTFWQSMRTFKEISAYRLGY